MLEDGLLHGLIRSSSPMAAPCTTTEVNFEYYSLEIRQLGAAAPGEYLVSIRVTAGIIHF